LANRTTLALPILVLFAWLVGPASGNGGDPPPAEDKIKLTGSLETGAADLKGRVVVDASAAPARGPSVPKMPPLPEIGTFSVAMPPFPDAVQDALPFAATESVSLAGGTYDFSTFDVAEGVIVSFRDAVTIRTSGVATILGQVVTSTFSRGSIRIECGGDFTLGVGARLRADVGGIDTDPTAPLRPGAVTLEVRGTFDAGPSSRIEALGGGAVRAHGLDGATGDISLQNTTVVSGDGGFAFQAAGALTARGTSSFSSITGDVLFRDSIGRTDLRGGSMTEMMASLRDKVLTKPDDTVVLPGHGPETTIGRERAHNPFLREASGTAPHRGL